MTTAVCFFKWQTHAGFGWFSGLTHALLYIFYKEQGMLELVVNLLFFGSWRNRFDVWKGELNVTPGKKCMDLITW